MHEPRLKLPGEEHAVDVIEKRPCGVMARYMFPAVQPIYSLAFDPALCGGAAPFAPVPFTTWLPPKHRAVYVVHNALLP